MEQPKGVVLPTLLAAVLTGVVIWLIAGPPPQSPKRMSAQQSVTSIK